MHADMCMSRMSAHAVKSMMLEGCGSLCCSFLQHACEYFNMGMRRERGHKEWEKRERLEWCFRNNFQNPHRQPRKPLDPEYADALFHGNSTFVRPLRLSSDQIV